MPAFIKKTSNLAGYLITWIVSAFGAAHHYVWPGFIVALIFLALHLLLSVSIKHELKLISMVTLMGCSIDSALYYYHYLTFAGNNPWFPLSPPWMWGVWLVFSSTLNSSLAILQQHRFFAASIGAVDLPVSYIMAAKIGALAWLQMWRALFILSVLWLFLLPLATWIAQPINKERREILE